VVAIALLLTLWLVPRHAAPGGAPWDLTGSLQILVGLTSLVYTIKELARQHPSALHMAIALALGTASIIVYLRRQQRQQHPLIDLTLFRLPDFGSAFAAAFLGTTGTVGLELVLSQYLQLVEQRTALQAAFVFLPTAIAGFFAGPLAGRIMHRVRPAAFAGGALVLAAACVLCLALVPPDSGHYPVIRMLMLVGVGLGLGSSVTFASSTIMNAAPPERGGMAASIEEVGFELGNSLGVAIFGSVMTAAYAMTLVLPETAVALPANVRDSLDEALLAADSLPPEMAETLRTAGRHAFAEALRAVLIAIGLLWLATGAWIARPQRAVVL
jgi:DHA2 family multidrug resistance protein-like MFS transporter